MTQQNASAAHSSAQSAEELSRQSETMRTLVQNLINTIEGNVNAKKVTHT